MNSLRADEPRDAQTSLSGPSAEVVALEPGETWEAQP